MSQLLDGYGTATLLICILERIAVVEALCNVVLEEEGADSRARELAEDVLHELDGGEAK